MAIVDTGIKIATRQHGAYAVTGFAKGAAMIGPNMATMLAFVLTDAAVAPEDLARLARVAAARTFNCVTVEGHTSTNDTLLLFANGRGPLPPEFFTQDRDFLRLHAAGVPHAGIAYCEKDTKSIGALIQGLVLIWELLEPQEMANRVEFL